MGLFKKKEGKAPPKLVMRNQAVQTVGETYFQVALVGLVAAGILGIVAIAIGELQGTRVVAGVGVGGARAVFHDGNERRATKYGDSKATGTVSLRCPSLLPLWRKCHRRHPTHARYVIHGAKQSDLAPGFLWYMR